MREHTRTRGSEPQDVDKPKQLVQVGLWVERGRQKADVEDHGKCLIDHPRAWNQHLRRANLN
jgi:hypothetical protein